MKFKTHKEGVSFQSSWLQGYINVSYARLVEFFGEPIKFSGGKTDAEWTILFEDGTYATIYNYKDGINYNGQDGTPVEEITDWHIGGQEEVAVTRVTSVLISPTPFEAGDAPLVFAEGGVDEMPRKATGVGEGEVLPY